MANREDHETQQLLQIFPNEVWSMILGEVKDAQDFQNISNATAHFHQILHPRAPQMLFPEVVKVLLEQFPTDLEKHREEESDYDSNEEEWDSEEDYHFFESDEEEIMEEAEQTDSSDEADSPEVNLLNQVQFEAKKTGEVIKLNVLRLRRICRASRKSVDQWLQAPDFYSKTNFKKTQDWNTFTFGIGYTGIYEYFPILFERQFHRFEEHFDSTHFDDLPVPANPFLSRGIFINVSNFFGFGVQMPTEPMDYYYNACIQLLRKYGHHLWYCRIDQQILDSGDAANFFNQKLQTILELMPNLRTLSIDGHIAGGEHKIRVKKEDQRKPFPHLEQLNTVSVVRVPRLVVKALLQSNPQIQQVDVQAPINGDKALQHVDSNKYCLELLPNLTAANFEVKNEEAFKRFRSAQVAGRVERLWLDASSLVEIPWQKIFRAAEFQFSDTLTQLCIRLPHGNKKEKIHQGLTLPNLKILKLVISDVEPLDYLLPLKHTLEQLSVEYRVKKGGIHFDKGVAIQNEEKAVLKLYRFWSEPVRSTIWTHFPRLKRLETTRTGEVTDHYVCTKEQ